jgi:hypothetical protein
MSAKTDLALCAISNWYPALHHVSIRTTLLPLDDAFVRYLLADGCFVPADEGCTDRPSGSDAPDDGWSDDERWSDDECDSSAPVPRFPELESAIVAAIRKHGGAVMPKLNWSAPKDAAWVLGGSLKCTSPRDVLLLLKPVASHRTTTGGHHVETGVALAMGMPVVLLGERENVFHHHDTVTVVPFPVWDTDIIALHVRGPPLAKTPTQASECY